MVSCTTQEPFLSMPSPRPAIDIILRTHNACGSTDDENCCFEKKLNLKQDACRGVHSACRREVNRHKLDICVLRFRQGRIQAFSSVGQNFLVLKWGGGLD